MLGARLVGEALALRLGVPALRQGAAQAPLGKTWDLELAAARPALQELAQCCAHLLATGRVPLFAMGRCAAALATLPVVARLRPDACVVWFDAHADANLPASRKAPYLGGMVISGAAGLWETGLGAGLRLENVVLVGSRDIDPDEQSLIDRGLLQHVPVGADLAKRLRAAIAGRPVYIHLDCDVLEPGIVPTEYRSPGGLTLDALAQACAALADCHLLGMEITEFEATWHEGGPVATADHLLDALQALLDALLRA